MPHPTFVSEGKPFRRFEVTSKAKGFEVSEHFVFVEVVHDLGPPVV